MPVFGVAPLRTDRLDGQAEAECRQCERNEAGEDGNPRPPRSGCEGATAGLYRASTEPRERDEFENPHRSVPPVTGAERYSVTGRNASAAACGKVGRSAKGLSPRSCGDRGPSSTSDHFSGE